jgi:GAF domain-containing protein
MQLLQKLAPWLRRHFPDEQARIKAGLLLQFAALSTVFAFGYFALTFVNLLTSVRLLMALDMLLFGLVIAWVWKSKQTFWPTQLFLLLCWLTTLVLLYFTGGIRSVILCWLPVTPLFALLLLDKTWSWVWFALACVQPVVYGLLSYLDVPLPAIPVTSTPLYILPVAIGALVILIVVSQIFDNQQMKLRLKLMDSNEQLAFSEEELRQNLEELRSMQDMVIKREQQLRRHKEKLERYIRLLMALVKSEPVQQGNAEEAVSEILRTAAEGMRVSRASVWHYQSNPAALVCNKLYNQANQTYESGAVLNAMDFPSYFKHIMSEGVIVANNARTDLATREFAASYLVPLDIYSLMDAPIYVSGRFHGVLCFEQQHTAGEWTAEDSFFAKSLADIVALAYVSANNRNAKEQIVAQGIKIMEQHDQLRNRADEIDRVNRELEQRVADRTQTLATQALRIREYAALNAGLLQGPSGKIQGLISLLSAKHITGTEQQLALQYLRESAGELNQIIAKINQVLDGEEHLRTDKFQRID